MIKPADEALNSMARGFLPFVSSFAAALSAAFPRRESGYKRGEGPYTHAHDRSPLLSVDIGFPSSLERLTTALQPPPRDNGIVRPLPPPLPLRRPLPPSAPRFSLVRAHRSTVSTSLFRFRHPLHPLSLHLFVGPSQLFLPSRSSFALHRAPPPLARLSLSYPTPVHFSTPFPPFLGIPAPTPSSRSTLSPPLLFSLKLRRTLLPLLFHLTGPPPSTAASLCRSPAVSSLSDHPSPPYPARSRAAPVPMRGYIERVRVYAQGCWLCAGACARRRRSPVYNQTLFMI